MAKNFHFNAKEGEKNTPVFRTIQSIQRDGNNITNVTRTADGGARAAPENPIVCRFHLEQHWYSLNLMFTHFSPELD